MNIGYLLHNSAGKYPEKTALVSDEGRWVYEELNQRTNRLAGAMLNAGLKKMDRIALLLYNSRYFVEVYFAAVKIGLIMFMFGILALAASASGYAIGEL